MSLVVLEETLTNAAGASWGPNHYQYLGGRVVEPLKIDTDGDIRVEGDLVGNWINASHIRKVSKDGTVWQFSTDVAGEPTYSEYPLKWFSARETEYDIITQACRIAGVAPNLTGIAIPAGEGTVTIGHIDLGEIQYEDDPVDPMHYKQFQGHEPKDAIRAWGLNFNTGSAVKYIARHRDKGKPIEDLRKAVRFLEFEIAALEAENDRR